MSESVIEPQPVKVTNWPSGGCGCLTALVVGFAFLLALDILWAIEGVKTAIDQNTEAIKAAQVVPVPVPTPVPAPVPTPAVILDQPGLEITTGDGTSSQWDGASSQ